ncbi:hypothetical protein C7S16_6362 [Burkholderia thailandensis]|uniref:Uncharacterized protein n=1 Tax=Burkholderia thailandensis TaxID=57975 RepID=A0AAW9CXT4_BURTH|nr:hypothetical protein [Burkholderia thailandensis]
MRPCNGFACARRATLANTHRACVMRTARRRLECVSFVAAFIG